MKALKSAAAHMLVQLPPSVRRLVATRLAFAEKFDIPIQSRVTFNGTLAIDRAILLAALRTLYARAATSVEVRMIDGSPATISASDRNGERLISLRTSEQVTGLPELPMLSPKVEERLEWFDGEVRRRLIDPLSIVEWRKKLADRSLDDEECSALQVDLESCLEGIESHIAPELQKPEATISVLVPDNALYYERLVGALKSSGTLQEYARGEAREHITALLRTNTLEAFKAATLLAGQSSLLEAIDTDLFARFDLATCFGWLAREGDRFSQIAGIELGLRLLREHPEIETSLTAIVRELAGAGGEDPEERLNLTSYVIVFTIGELARTGLFRDKPPFWRRLAAIAQASVIERQLTLAGVRSTEGSDWMERGYGHYFFLQSLIDLRAEPRWLPEFIAGGQLLDEFRGRALLACEKNKDSLGVSELSKLLIDPETGFAAQARVPMAFIPGPLEGGFTPPRHLPSSITEEVEKALAADVLDPKTFLGIVNGSLIFGIGPELVRAAAEALRRVKYRIRQGDNGDEIFAVMLGLARVAAVSRSVDLGLEVRTLMRVAKSQPNADLRVDAAMRVGFVAAAAEAEFEAWARAIGEALNDLAYSNLKLDDARVLNGHLDALLSLEPRLWATCAGARAALQAVRGSWS